MWSFDSVAPSPPRTVRASSIRSAGGYKKRSLPSQKNDWYFEEMPSVHVSSGGSKTCHFHSHVVGPNSHIRGSFWGLRRAQEALLCDQNPNVGPIVVPGSYCCSVVLFNNKIKNIVHAIKSIYYILYGRLGPLGNRTAP